MEAEERLGGYRDIWARKPALQRIYATYYRRIAAACRPGRILEIGGGSGNFPRNGADVVSTDILPAPWLDVVCDAQALPFKDASFDNIVMVDVLHHIERPVRFFREAERVLARGGRIICVEPAITPLSYLLYKYLHPEPLDLAADPLLDGPVDQKRDPFLSNQALPTLLAGAHRSRFGLMFPGLSLKSVTRFDFLAYPLSGGFRKWSLIPSVAIEPMVRVERGLEALLGRFMAFRMLLVFEKTGDVGG